VHLLRCNTGWSWMLTRTALTLWHRSLELLGEADSCQGNDMTVRAHFRQMGLFYILVRSGGRGFQMIFFRLSMLFPTSFAPPPRFLRWTCWQHGGDCKGGVLCHGCVSYDL
jgi:hypothetical protein